MKTPKPDPKDAAKPNTSMDSAAYWKLRALLKDMAALPSELQAELQRQQAAMQERINQAMTDAGLDPAKVYRLNDADLTATLQP